MARIADYELGALLGQGNHGHYYRCAPPSRLGVDAEWVAVKVLDRQASDDEYRRFANELRLFAAVQSPHLVRLLDAGQDAGVLFYATPFHPRGSLGNPVEAVDAAEAIAAVASAARGAHALHEAGVAHRDIKPTNIMLDDTWARLSDLGLAQVLNPGQTVTGHGPIGSIEYMDPGTVVGEKASRASDLWSLGATLHRALTGRSVYGELPTGDVLSALRHVLHSRPVIDPELPEDQREVIEWCVAADPGDRPATALQLAERLEVL